LEISGGILKTDDISAAAFHRFISQPASGRSSALPCLAAILVLSEIWRLLRLHGLFFGTSKFYQLIRYSYASGLDSFGSQPHSRNIMKKDHIKHLSCLIWSFYHIYSHLEIRVEKSKSATVNDNPASPFPFSSLLSHANISPSLVSSHKQLYFAQSFSSYTSVGSP